MWTLGVYVSAYPLYLAGILYTLRCGEHEQPRGDKSSPAGSYLDHPVQQDS